MAYRASLEALQAQFLTSVSQRDELGKDDERRHELQQQIDLLAARIDQLTPHSYVARYSWRRFVASARLEISAFVRSVFTWKSLGFTVFALASVLVLALLATPRPTTIVSGEPCHLQL